MGEMLMPWPGDIIGCKIKLKGGEEFEYKCNRIECEKGVLSLSTVHKGSIRIPDQISGERSYALDSIEYYETVRQS